MQPHDDQTDSKPDLPLCPHCLEEVDELEHFCHACGKPITAHAAIDPMGQILAAGQAYRNATTERPKPIILIGMWLIFGPPVLFLLWTLYGALSGLFHELNPPSVNASIDGPGSFYLGDPLSVHSNWFEQAVGAAMLVGMLLLYLAILWKVSRHHFECRTGSGAESQ